MTIRATRWGLGARFMPSAAEETITSLTEGEATKMSRDENASGPEEKHVSAGAQSMRTATTDPLANADSRVRENHRVQADLLRRRMR